MPTTGGIPTGSLAQQTNAVTALNNATAQLNAAKTAMQAATTQETASKTAMDSSAGTMDTTRLNMESSRASFVTASTNMTNTTTAINSAVTAMNAATAAMQVLTTQPVWGTWKTVTVTAQAGGATPTASIPANANRKGIIILQTQGVNLWANPAGNAKAGESDLVAPRLVYSFPYAPKGAISLYVQGGLLGLLLGQTLTVTYQELT